MDLLSRVRHHDLVLSVPVLDMHLQDLFLILSVFRRIVMLYLLMIIFCQIFSTDSLVPEQKSRKLFMERFRLIDPLRVHFDSILSARQHHHL
jgi:hypothetical protein